MPRGPRGPVVASHKLIVLVTPEERDRFFAVAHERRLSLSELVRSLLTQEERRVAQREARKRVRK